MVESRFRIQVASRRHERIMEQHKHRELGPDIKGNILTVEKKM